MDYELLITYAMLVVGIIYGIIRAIQGATDIMTRSMEYSKVDKPKELLAMLEEVLNLLKEAKERMNVTYSNELPVLGTKKGPS